MTFNSFDYFLFLPVVWLVHHLLGQRLRWLFLLAASLVFYASLEVPYLLGVIVCVTVATYGFGRWIHVARSLAAKRRLLWSGIAVNLLILVALKYVPFLTENLNLLLGLLGSPARVPHTQLLVAVGVSYYVFQAISYLSDIYLEIEEPERHFGYFALYLAFFPKLLQGPIERAGDLLPQLKAKYAFDYDNMRFGLLLFTWGLFKKVVLADRLGLYVDTVYGDASDFNGVTLLAATYAYAFQIYFDFSGYTDMALGTARLFNIRLTDNFNSPYLATSVADFWRRWHITFSRWILDYIFKPLQMFWRGGKEWGTAAALVVTFLVSGIWHGASWGFVVWGLLHGGYMACSVFWRPYQKRLYKASKLEKTSILRIWQIFATFHLVCFAWIFFRAANLEQSLAIISGILNDLRVSDLASLSWLKRKGLERADILLIFASFAAVWTFDRARHGFTLIFSRPLAVRWLFYYLLVATVLLFASTREGGFIYFQF